MSFIQLIKTPIHGSVEELLIPDHPEFFKLANEADSRETFGMTHLYFMLTHVDTHPEHLTHLFHELGKVSYEGQLECSHPGVRPLPEAPIPTLSIMVNEHLEWLMILPFDEDIDFVDIHAEDEVDDVDGDMSIAMALNYMVISSVQESTQLTNGKDIPTWKRMLSKVLSPQRSKGVKSFESDLGQLGYIILVSLSLAIPNLGADELKSGPSTTFNPVIMIPSPAICDNGGTSDISAWTKSEEDSQMQIFSHSEGNRITENIQHVIQLKWLIWNLKKDTAALDEDNDLEDYVEVVYNYAKYITAWLTYFMCFPIYVFNSYNCPAKMLFIA
ncbi:hypothetical protein BD769DRAFT_1393672 [Suillus cothurnatus]|nr:hypothetical protein BD769DRAFT_1393672 [Suillus cothurnatus]